MPARSLNKAIISFGLVSVPVKVYPGTNPSSRIGFHLLHAKDKERLKQQYVCPKDGHIVSRNEMVKGYEYAKGRYVVFTREELKQLEQDPTHGIEIAEFVPEARVDPVFFEKSYYLGPDTGGEKPYALLIAAMRAESFAAIATYASHGKDYLVLLRASDRALVMHQLYYSDEIRSADEVPAPARKASEAEIKLARQLMHTIAHDRFDPSQYEDDVKARMKELIARKQKGQPLVAARAERPEKVVDLMSALKASLKRGQAARGRGRRTARTAARKSRRPRAAARKAS
jgi:DNA end-binding protein Ku